MSKCTFVCLSLLLLGLSSSAYGDEPPAKAGARLQKQEVGIVQVVDMEELGHAVLAEAVRSAAVQLRDVKGSVNSVSVTFRFSVHTDNLPDPCFEDCISSGQSSALRCYVRCNAPRPPELTERQPTFCVRRIIRDRRVWVCLAQAAPGFILE